MQAETRYMAAFIKKNHGKSSATPETLFNQCIKDMPEDLKSKDPIDIRFIRFGMLHGLPAELLDYVLRDGFD